MTVYPTSSGGNQLLRQVSRTTCVTQLSKYFFLCRNLEVFPLHYLVKILRIYAQTPLPISLLYYYKRDHSLCGLFNFRQESLLYLTIKFPLNLADVALQLPSCVVHEYSCGVILKYNCMNARKTPRTVKQLRMRFQ